MPLARHAPVGRPDLLARAARIHTQQSAGPRLRHRLVAVAVLPPPPHMDPARLKGHSIAAAAGSSHDAPTCLPPANRGHRAAPRRTPNRWPAQSSALPGCPARGRRGSGARVRLVPLPPLPALRRRRHTHASSSPPETSGPARSPLPWPAGSPARTASPARRSVRYRHIRGIALPSWSPGRFVSRRTSAASPQGRFGFNARLSAKFGLGGRCAPLPRKPFIGNSANFFYPASSPSKLDGRFNRLDPPEESAA